MRYQLLLLIFLFFICGCSLVSDSFDTISPLKGEEVDYCCFTLEWDEYENADEYQIQISTDESFENIFLDLTSSSNSMILEHEFEPGQTYYWKVIPNSSETSIESYFKIKDYAAIYAGEYPATRTGITQIHSETIEETTTTTLKIAESERSCCLLIDDREFFYYGHFLNPDYISIVDSKIDGRGGHIYFNTDSIAITSTTYHSDGFIKTIISAKLR